MANPSKFYLTHIHQQSGGYRATWNPGKPLEIGAIGKLEKGVFNQYATLADKGIPMNVKTSISSLNMDYTSHDSVAINTKLSGKAPVAGSALTDLDAGFSFDFKGDKSIVFQTGGYKTAVIANLEEIEQKILAAYEDGSWDKDSVIITELITADTATIIISTSSNNTLELKATANVGTPALKLADASLGLTIAQEKGSSMKFLAEAGLTPLYKVMGVRDPWWGPADFGTKNAEKAAADELKERGFDERELED